MRNDSGKYSAEKSAVINDNDRGGGIYFPSSFKPIDLSLMAEIEAADGEERLSLILKRCFDIDIDLKGAAINWCFPIVELEENVYVLELEGAKGFMNIDSDKKSLIIAAILVSTYSDLALDGTLKVFLPFTPDIKDLLIGVVIAKRLGLCIEIAVGLEADCLAAIYEFNCAQDIKCYMVERPAIYDTISNFNEYDDYVLDPISAIAASAFEDVEDEMDGVPSLIVSVSSPMRYAREVLLALGVKSKDDKEARRKLEDLFAVEPIEE